MKIVRLFDGGTKMAKNKKDLDLADSSNLNQIKKSTNVVFNSGTDLYYSGRVHLYHFDHLRAVN